MIIIETDLKEQCHVPNDVLIISKQLARHILSVRRVRAGGGSGGGGPFVVLLHCARAGPAAPLRHAEAEARLQQAAVRPEGATGSYLNFPAKTS